MKTRSYVLAGMVLAVGLAPWAPKARAQAAGTVVPRITQAVDENRLVALQGSVHPLARAQYDQGAVADSQPIRRALLLLQRSPGQETALRQLLDDQQTKTSPNFHRWMTPAQFGQQFGPADADIQAVTTWLTSHGFQVNRVSAGRTVIEFSGNAGQIRNAFHTQIHRYVVNGETHLANAEPAQIPAALAAVVAGPVSLHNFPKKAQNHVLGVFSKSKETGEVKPLQRFSPAGTGSAPSPAYTFPVSGGCSANSSTSPCYAVGPADFDTIYNVPSPLIGAPSPLDGTGQTIAIVGDSQICTASSIDFGTSFIGPNGNQVTCSSDDVAAFRKIFGLSTTNLPTVIVDGPDPGFNGDETEGDLDVQWAGGVAPNAAIDYVIAEDTEASAGIDLAAEHIIDNNLAPVMSESYGTCEAYVGTFYGALWEQAAAQGMTVIVSAGDSGSAGCDSDSQATAGLGLEVNGIASTPFNVAVGGTDFDYSLTSYGSTYWNSTNTSTVTLESAKGYIPETTWNDSCAQSFLTGCASVSSTSYSLNIVGGSGGQSNCLNAIFQPSGAFTCAAAFTGSSLLGYPKPIWQPVATASGLSISTDLTRDLPDISLFASDGLVSASFYIICEQDLNPTDGACSTATPFYTFVGVGGTSSSAPDFAGIMALVNQKTAARQGNANYVLYPLYQNQVTANLACNSSAAPSSQCTFNDVTKGNNSVPCAAGAPNCSATSGTGDLISSTAGNVAAWKAGAGYDLATGLGSLNVTNFISNWATAMGTFMPTTTTLCLVSGNTGTAAPTNCSPLPTTLGIPTPIVHGTVVSGSITVSQTSNGQVLTNLTSTLKQPEDAALIGVFSGGATIPVDRLDVNSGNVLNANIYPLTSGTIFGGFTQELVGGTYTVHAHYAGDGKYGSSDSNTISVVVSPEASSSAVSVIAVNPLNGNTSTVSSAPYGTLDLVRVDVVGASGLESATGAVILTDNGAPVKGPTAGSVVSSLNLNSEGYLEDQTPFLNVGAHSFQASYGGDVSYSSNVSATSSFTVTLAPTTTTLTPSATVIATGGTETLTAFVDSLSLGNAMTGTVAFNAGSTAIAGTVQYTPTFDTNGFSALKATLTYKPSATATISAVYSGDANYAASPTSSTVTVTVGTPGVNLSSINSSSNPISISSPGGTGQTSLTIAAASGYTGSVGVTCTIAAVSPTTVNDTPTCSPASTSANLTSTTTSVNVPFNIDTTAFVAAVPGGTEWFPAGAVVALACIFLIGMPTEKRRGMAWLALLLLIVAAGAVACGGGSVIGNGVTNPGTTVGSYVVTITATPAGATAQNWQIPLNVQ